MTLDLPMIWAVIIATATFLYVVLDGFDLGVGILFPFATDQERDVMVASIAPVWDGNETWLVLGGGGLFAAFPLAYAVLMPAMYLPIGFMLTALIFRGVAFEFRAKAGPRGRRWWTFAFAAGSLVATVAQGLVLGGFLQGIEVECLELLCVDELFAHGVGQGRVLVEGFQIQLIRPPVLVRRGPNRGVGVSSSQRWALACFL